MNSQDDVDVTESEDVDDEALPDADESLCGKDITLAMKSVPFKEKVEKWLMTCDDSATHARRNVKNCERVFHEKIVLSEKIEETESLHSVDTEQYIKSNRTKTTTKITTTTIRKYYSLLKVGRNPYNNNDENYTDDLNPLPAIKEISTNKGEIRSCKVGRRSSRRQNNRTSNLHVGDGQTTSEKPKEIKPKRSHQVVGKANGSDTNKVDNQNISASTSRACTAQRNVKRVKVTKKRNQRTTGGCRNKLKTAMVKKSTSHTKLKSGLKRDRDNIKNTNQVSSDSEEDILLTSYRTYPNVKYFKSF